MTQQITAPQQTQDFVRQLEVFKDRLLRVDWRNRSILFRKVHLKWSLDLAEFPNIALHLVEKGLKSSDAVSLLPDSDLSENAELKRHGIVALFRTERLIEDETGLHDFFIGFPFLEGHLTPDHFVRGPLVLIPARLERRKSGHTPGWYLVFPEGSPLVFNQALLAAARKIAGLQMDPKVDEKLEDLVDTVAQGGDVVPSFLAGIEEILRENNFPIEPLPRPSEPQKIVPVNEADLGQLPRQPLHLTNNVVLGTFPQASSAIFHDYEEIIRRVSNGETNQGIIRNLLEAPTETTTPQNSLYALEGRPLDKISDAQLNFVLPSDSSQDAVVIEAQLSPCVVVRGPPGTGKSQVIVNLISNALWKGQKVLLVCQKRAALDVVFQRLDKVGLGQYAVLLHDERIDRGLAYRQLHQFLSKGLHPRGYGSEEIRVQQMSRELDDLVTKLNKIADPLWKEYYGIRLHNLYLSLDPKYTPHMDLEGLERKLDYPTLTKLMEKLPNIERGSKRFDIPLHPYSKRASFANLGQSDRIAILRSLQDALEKSRFDYFIKDFGPAETQRDLSEFLKWHHRHLRVIAPAWLRRGRRGGRFLQSQNETHDDEAARKWIQKISRGRDLLASLSKLRPYFSQAGCEQLAGLPSKTSALQTSLEALIARLNEFDEIQAHDSRVSALSADEKNLVNRCLNQLKATDSWEYALPQEVYFLWVDAIEKANPELRGPPFEEYLELRDKLDKFLEEKRLALGRTLGTKLEYLGRTPVLPVGHYHGNRDPATDWNKLAHEFGKKRRLKPLRRLYEEYDFELDKVARCWLVSPESVSEVFPLKRAMFDLIVFDEASQLAVERAIPTLYRAARVVIAGDEKQLRPFDLFQIREDEEDEEETPEALKTESLLMLAKRIFGCEYLTWHYRSKYQELIDFSNHAFYEGRLQIAGTILRNPSFPPIQWVSVDGQWNERRQNPVEAKKVVDIIKEILRKVNEGDSLPSLGVVTFNDPQRLAILDEIDLRSSRDSEFDRLIELAENPKSGNIDDRIFVKNIENVQGDERDIIIFSIGYGKDNDGRLKMVFGSLNMEGGENRLNVAVTRAREQVFVVCSFDPTDLKAEQATNQGPKLLRQYLDYSLGVSDNNEDAIKSVLNDLNPHLLKRPSGPLIFDSELERQIYEALTKIGYEIDTQIGNSGYRIDLAIVHPKDPSRYVLAVECDGSTFHSARSARERDVFRQRFLESHGWVVERVWSRNWWRDPEREIHRLKARIEQLSVIHSPGPMVV